MLCCVTRSFTSRCPHNSCRIALAVLTCPGRRLKKRRHSTFSRRWRTRAMHDPSTSLDEGARECRVLAHPQPRVENRNTRVSHHGRTGRTRHSRTRMVLTACFGLSPGIGLFCPRRSRDHRLASLMPASRHQDHTTSPSAYRARSSSRDKRPPHPAPTCRDDRDTPLFGGAGRAGF
jgi:hypothetical protein